MDQMLTGYSCKRSTNRLSLAMFYNMLDIAGLASFIIYDELNPAKQSDKRRSFIIELARQLVIPHSMEVCSYKTSNESFQYQGTGILSIDIRCSTATIICSSCFSTVIVLPLCCFFFEKAT
ncbi:uncharacterized protein LOC128855153 [Anastrepha ludens]|uniref:uncharacterized protein LOC128855153 n=1 Tax=Anastrepha ludens TaxID=28586 RepID=UPI0023B1CEC7|nr:uncharacterized protein LOC128855153 [Anastrepha ludens]